MSRRPVLENYVNAFNRLVQARMALHGMPGDLVEECRELLRQPGIERSAGIALFGHLNEEQQRRLLGAMVEQALYSHGLTKDVWRRLREVEGAALEHELTSVERRIDAADYEEVGCFLGLLAFLGRASQAVALAERLAGSEDVDVKDVAEAFLGNA